MSIVRGETVAGVIDSLLYVAGGALPSDISSALEVYNPATNTWTTLRSMDYARGEAAGGVIDAKLYVAGGYTRSIRP